MQVKEEDAVTVGQVVAKITPGDVDESEDAGQGQEAAGGTGAPSKQAEALDKESPVSAGDHLGYHAVTMASRLCRISRALNGQRSSHC